jgi:chemotaxis protein methyltransferase CheR
MNKADFEFIAGLIKEASGLVLNTDKGYLLESRLAPVAQRHGHATLEHLIAALRVSRAGRLLPDVVEAMTTNESFFFRDIKPFDIFRSKFLPEILERRAAVKSLRIWCAAASTGQEPYSLAMLLQEEAAKLQGWHIQILGTDLSNEALERARSGIYTHFEVQRGLAIQRLIRFFDKQGELWQIKPDIRSMVQYRNFNLLQDPRPLGRFDVVFCRNVLIYFDQPTKTQVLQSIATTMDRDGILVLGGAETVFGISNAFRPIADHYGVYAVATEPVVKSAVGT